MHLHIQRTDSSASVMGDTNGVIGSADSVVGSTNASDSMSDKVGDNNAGRGGVCESDEQQWTKLEQVSVVLL